MIPDETLDRIRRANPLADVVREAGIELKQRGPELTGLCPFHDDHHPSLRVNEAKAVCCCDSCGFGGDVFKFVMQRDGLTFPQAVENLARRAGIPLNGNGGSSSAGQEAGGLAHKLSSSCTGAAQARPAVTLPTADAKFAEGFAQRLGVKADTITRLIAENALGYDAQKNAIVFGCQNADGSIAALHLRGKSADGSRWFAWRPEGCKAGLWRLPALKRAEKVIVCEGETDAIAALNVGLEADGFAVVAKTGANVFPADAVEQFRGKTVFIVSDLDEGGRKGAAATAEKLRDVADVRIVTLPEMPAQDDGKPRKDLRDWLGLGNGKAELLKLLDAATGANGPATSAADVMTAPAEPVRYGLPKRFCYDLGGWIADYFAVFEPRTEPSYAFHLAGALAAMDTILGRRVYWEFGSTRLFPQDYYLLAGRVAAARKSTAMNCGARVVRCLETEAMPYRMADGFSYNSMPDEFAEFNLRLLLLDEFSSLLVQNQTDYGKGCAQAFNSMWQGVDKVRLRFRTRDKSKAIVIEAPTLTMLAGTSLELLQANLRAGDHGGFTSRLLTFYAEGDSKDLPEPQAIEQSEVQTLADKLRKLMDGVGGRASWTADAAQVWNEWYRAQKQQAKENPNGFASRKGDHVRKIALKLELSRSGKAEVGADALGKAILIADKAEESWRKVFGTGAAGGGFISSRADEALTWLQANACAEGIPYWKLAHCLKLDAQTADKVLKTLEVWERVRVEPRTTGGRPAKLVFVLTPEGSAKR